jgi:predicted transcriptional regulator
MRLKMPKKMVAQIDHAATGRLIRRLRKKDWVSQWSLSDSMGISASALCQLEKGRLDWTEEKFRLAIEMIPECVEFREQQERADRDAAYRERWLASLSR